MQFQNSILKMQIFFLFVGYKTKIYESKKIFAILLTADPI